MFYGTTHTNFMYWTLSWWQRPSIDPDEGRRLLFESLPSQLSGSVPTLIFCLNTPWTGVWYGEDGSTSPLFVRRPSNLSRPRSRIPRTPTRVNTLFSLFIRIGAHRSPTGVVYRFGGRSLPRPGVRSPSSVRTFGQTPIYRYGRRSPV